MKPKTQTEAPTVRGGPPEGENTSTLAAIAAVLRSARRVLAFCHVNPDGDALGSMLALGWLLRALQPHATPEALQITLACADPVPSKLNFLPGADLKRLGGRVWLKRA